METSAHQSPLVLLMYVQRMVPKRTFEHLGNLGIMSLAAFLESKGHCARTFVGTTIDALRLVAEESRTRQIRAVGLYCDYDNQSAVETLSSAFKAQYNFPVVVGGPQTIYLGSEFLRASRCDALVRGDGEYTLLELLESLEWTARQLRNVQGIVFLDNGEEVVTAARPALNNLDSLPCPTNALQIRAKSQRNLSVISARGCPYRCTFCFEGGNSKLLRLRSVENVMHEIHLRLNESPDINYIWFADDTFTLNYDRTAEFCRRLAELRKQRDVVWFCEGHAGFLSKHPDLLQQMVDSGMVRMQIGMETGWQPSMDKYNKGASIREVEEVIQRCYAIGLPQLAGNFIIGGADETEETLEATMAHVEKLVAATPGLLDLYTSFIIPLPNTAISLCPGSFGIRVLDPASLTSLEDFPVTETVKLTREQICAWRYRFVKHVSDTMKTLFQNHAVPKERIRQHFYLAKHHGLASSWYTYLYSRDAATRLAYSGNIGRK